MLFFRRRPDADAEFKDPDRLQELMLGERAHQVIDVRSREEYESGHIPGALVIPHTEIATRPPSADKDLLIVVYCQTGIRSRYARKRLIAGGYQHVVDFGAVSRWPGDLEYGTTEAGR